MMFKPIHFFRLNLVIAVLLWVTGAWSQEMIFPGPPAGIRNTDLFNVKLYGAVGNGIKDDTVAIQAALNAVSSAGGSVYVPCGTYKLTSPLTMSISNTQLYGDGACSILSWPNGLPDASSGNVTGYLILGSGDSATTTVYSFLRVRRLHIKGNAPQTGTTPAVTLQTPNAITFGYGAVQFSEVSDCIIEQAQGESILLTTTAAQMGPGNLIQRNVFSNSNLGGISAASGNLKDVKITDNHFTTINGAAVEWSSDGALIARNTFENIQSGAVTILTSAIQTRWSTIADNMMYQVGNNNGGTVTNGIQLGEGVYAERILVIGNTLRDIYGHAIIATGSNLSDLMIVGNTIHGYGANGRTLAVDIGGGPTGIQMRNVPNSTITGNVVKSGATSFTSAEAQGLEVGGGSFTGTVDGNIIRGTYSGGGIVRTVSNGSTRLGVNHDLTSASGPTFLGGAADSVTNPALSIGNARILTLLGSTPGTTDAYIWYDSGNALTFGANNNSRLSIGSGGSISIGGKSGSATAGQLFYTIGGGLQVAAPTGGDKGSGTINAAAGLYDNNVRLLPVLSGTTGSIGGGALLAGQCSSGTATVTGSTTSMVALADPNTYPGDGIIWDAQVTSANTVTVKVCAIVALTPTTSTYNVRVLQ